MRILRLFAAGGWALALLCGFTGSDDRESIQPSSALLLKGTSTLHNYECTTSVFRGEVDFDPATNTFPRVDVTIPVRSIHSGNSSMDDKMYDALHADKYPDIEFRLIHPDSEKTAGTSDSLLVVHGSLKISGKEKSILLPLHLVRGPDGTLLVSGTEKLLMTDFGIDPPSFMLGVLKTGNEVSVEFHLNLKNIGPP